ncbi:relaxase domain-containing protein [Streptomyces sp. NPDC026589]|uniref:relaxase domain-containing protein n=1 Tax=Streptomyces sp. NPDC026589 TaxID=3155609 RepID=UPI0033FD9CEB
MGAGRRPHAPVIERAHERAVAQALRWLEDEVAETRWASGRGRAKTPALGVAAFRRFDNRDCFPLLHEAAWSSTACSAGTLTASRSGGAGYPPPRPACGGGRDALPPDDDNRGV